MAKFREIWMLYSFQVQIDIWRNLMLKFREIWILLYQKNEIKNLASRSLLRDCTTSTMDRSTALGCVCLCVCDVRFVAPCNNRRWGASWQPPECQLSPSSRAQESGGTEDWFLMNGFTFYILHSTLSSLAESILQHAAMRGSIGSRHYICLLIMHHAKGIRIRSF